MFEGVGSVGTGVEGKGLGGWTFGGKGWRKDERSGVRRVMAGYAAARG